MARSRLSEAQVLDADFLSEGEYVALSTTMSGHLQAQIDQIGYSSSDWQIIDSSYTASVSDRLMIDSSSYIPPGGNDVNFEFSGGYTAPDGDDINLGTDIIVYLPTNPSIGNTVYFLDIAGNCSANTTTISGNGNKIMGSLEDLDVDSDGAHFALIYSNETYGWRIN